MYGKPSIGCYFDHANYSNDELSVKIIELATLHGFKSFGADWTREESNLLNRAYHEVLSKRRDDSQSLYKVNKKAIDWMNEQETRAFLYWGNNGEANAFGLWPDIEGARENCEFVSSKRNEFPPVGYVGKWLHISDHGNATLYFKPEENEYNNIVIWSIV